MYSNTALEHKKIAVIGMGISNVSLLRYLAHFNLDRLTVFDTRENPPHLDKLDKNLEVKLGPLNEAELKSYDLLVLSPGLSIYTKEIAAAVESGVEIVGDVELFAREAKAPVIGITGSNGKSTVTALTGEMARCAGIKVALGANFGNPVFDILSDEVELYVLELSSFELETTSSLKLKAGVILNVSEDHLDRYHGDIEEYASAKKRIFLNCEQAVVNRDDARTLPDDNRESVSFGLDSREYGRISENGRTYLAVNGEKVLDTEEMIICGVHNELNALSCMALCDAAGISREAQLEALKSFKGLEHRCQLVRELDKVCYYNDSKATNVASSEAAIRGLKNRHPEGLILLAGGLGKGQDFSPLKQYLGHEVAKVFCFGRDKQKILELDSERCVDTDNLQEALSRARAEAKAGQAVLLSPACASFDQFKGFEDRGHKFVEMVNSL